MQLEVLVLLVLLALLASLVPQVSKELPALLVPPDLLELLE